MAASADQKKKSDRDVRRFRRVVKSAQNSIADDVLCPVDYLDALSEELRNAHKDAEQSTDDYRDLLATPNDDGAILETDTLLDTLQTELSTVLNDIAKLKAKHIQTQKETKVRNNEATSSFRIQKFETPKFSGDVPAFRTHYRKHVEDRHGKDPYALISCLSGEAQKLVKPVEDDYEEMMKRLESKYGRNEKQVDVILQDIKNLKRVADGDTRGLYKMIEVIENCWLDLKRMGLQSEMDTTNICFL